MTEKLSGMRVRIATLSKVLLTIGVCGLAGAWENVQPESPLADKRAVQAVVENIIAADNVEDLERVLSYYADNAILITPEGADVSGTDAIRKHYEALFAAVDFAIKTRIDDITVAADLAVVRGLNSVSAIAADSQHESCAASKYLMTLMRTDGEWKISQLIWTNQTKEC